MKRVSRPLRLEGINSASGEPSLPQLCADKTSEMLEELPFYYARPKRLPLGVA